MDKRRTAPLSKSQEGIYVECMSNPQSTMYNVPFLIEFGPDGDRERLRTAIQKVIDAYPTLETILYTDDAGNIQQSISEGSCEIQEVCVTDEEFESLKKTLVRSFDLNGGSLCRWEIYHTPSTDYVFRDIHHIIVDGSSYEILNPELWGAYCGKNLLKAEYTGTDAAYEEAVAYGSRAYEEDKAYFGRLLDGYDGDCLPVQDCYGDIPQQGWLKHRFFLNHKKFKELKKQNGVSTTTYFTSVMGFLVSRYNYRDDSVIATIYNGRDAEQKKDAVAMLVKTLPFVTDISGNPSVSDFLKKEQANLTESRKHGLYSFVEMATEYGVRADINFAYQGKLLEYNKIKESNMKLSRIYDENHIENTSLLFELADLEDGCYELQIGYRADKFSQSFVKNMAKAYEKIACEFLEKEFIDDVDMTDEDCRRQVDAFNATEHPYNTTETVVELFKKQAKEYPEREALVYMDKRFTYGQLDEITDRLAYDLRKKGIGKDTMAGVLIPRCEYMVICALGILKAGGGYLPMDATYPAERLNLMLRDSGAKVLLTTAALNELIDDDFSGIRMMVDDIAELPEGEGELPIPEARDLFVMLYTSGSTGLPKGVMLEHGNLMAFCDWAVRYFHMDKDTRSGAYASYGFDANMFDTYPVLTVGGTLFIVDEGIRLDLLELQKYYNENKITQSLITTQVGRQFAMLDGTTSMQHLVVGGEKLVPLDPPDYHMHNVYGPTECTVLVTTTEVDRRYKDVPIGPAIDNVKLYIVDKNGKLLPPGAAGELWISSPQVARGYRNRPQQTASVFTENPFCDQEGYKRVYHTGDIVRFMESGSLQFIGRRDGQVKVRGFRIELTEVEEVIRRFPGIKDVTVAAYDDPAGGKYIVAYIVSNEMISIEALNAFIGEEKPPYMIPAVTMQIDSIPMTQNQKVNRRALPIPEKKFEDVKLPENEMQKKIFDIVAEVIGTDAFGIQTSLYLAGLTSVGAVRLNVLLSKAFDKVVQTRDLKEHDTVEKLESFFRQTDQKQESVAMQKDYPLTKNQEGIFVESMANPTSTIYNIPILLELPDTLDLEKLAFSLAAAVEAHSYIKTQLFMAEDGDIRQKRMEEESFTVQDVEMIADPDFDPSAGTLTQPFTLLGGRLFRIKLIKATRNYLFVEMHHIICDGTSLNLFFEDVSRAYAGEPLKAEAFSGFEAAVLEERQRQGIEYEQAKKYWQEMLGGCEADYLPVGDLEEGDWESDELEYYGVYATAEDVKHFCKANRLSLNGFFTAAFGLLLARYNGSEESVFATVYNGRNDSRLAETVAMLVKTFPVICSLSKEREGCLISSYISEIAEQLRKAMDNDLYSFGEISRNLGINADVMFVYQGESFRFDRLCGQPVKMIKQKRNRAKAPLSLTVFLQDEKIQYQMEYRSDRFSHAYVEGFLDAMDMAVSEFLANKPLGEISIFSDRARIKTDAMNATRQPYDHNKTVVDLFRENAKADPDREVLVYLEKRFTYRQLDEMTDRLAGKLRELGVKRETVVGVLIPRCEYMVICALGILKAGGAYLPLDVTYPSERLNLMVRDSGAKILLAAEDLSSVIDDSFTGVRMAVEDIPTLPEYDQPLPSPLAEDLFVMLYTSGSTGVPKGVMLEHGNLIAFCSWARKYYHIDREARGAAYASYGFDACLFELYPVLTAGGTLYIIDEKIRMNLGKLQAYYNENKITHGTITTQVGRQFAMMKGTTTLQHLTVGGEKLVPLDPPPYHMHNAYGPTECTIMMSVAEVDRKFKDVPIGAAIDNFKLYVVDKNGKRLPPGAVGELWAAGPQVARGYLNRPEQTAAVFTKNPFCCEKEYEKVYHTGDVVSCMPDGIYRFIGRRDAQVKIRGFRIELTEVEEVIRRFDGIKDVTVAAYDAPAGGKYIVAYVVSDQKISTDALHAFIMEEKPPYMVPAVTMQIDKIPMTQNQKVNKRALPKPKIEIKNQTDHVDRTELEQSFCEMFAEILGLPKVSEEDDFFALGGTSLAAYKIAMRCMTEQIPIVYADIFQYTTPAKLAAHAAKKNGGNGTTVGEALTETLRTDEKEPLHEVLKYNCTTYVKEIKSQDIGNVLVVGATGFLGIHVVKTLLEEGCDRIYCLVRKKKNISAKERLKTLLMYYFDDTMENEFDQRILPVDGDITDTELTEKLKNCEFDTVINCAASVKHFAADDLLDKVNVQGVKNLIDLCMAFDKKLIQVSTVSIAGESVDDCVPEEVFLTENRLELGQALDNKYTQTKYQAEKAVLEAVAKGLRGKIIRVGNLMSRETDGEFQINFSTNGFMNRLKAYTILQKFPLDDMDREVEISAIDCTAQAIIRLAGTPDQFTVFHAYSCHPVHMANILKVMNEYGIHVDVVEEEEFRRAFNGMLADEAQNTEISGLISYMSSGKEKRRYVSWNNSFTVKALYRLGFSWPLVGESYIRRAIDALTTLGFFKREE